MNVTEHLLTKIAQECAEVAQRCSKAIEFGLNEIQPGQELDNAQRIIGEMNDLRAVIEMAEEHGILPIFVRERENDAFEAKKAKVVKFMSYSREMGMLIDKLSDIERKYEGSTAH